MRRPRLQLLIAFAYDGWPFHGVAPQPDLPTAGGALLDRLEAAAGVRPRALALAARTDAGVHGAVQPATCYLPFGTDPGVLAAAEEDRDDGLHGVALRVVSRHVHARGLARAKRYVYRVQDGLTEAQAQPAEAALGPHGRPVHPDPGLPGRCWQVAGHLDIDAMARAGADLIGSHDMSALRARRDRATSPVKTVSALSVERHHDHVAITLAGDAFLRQQVRMTAALLVSIGQGRRPVDDVPRVLASRDVRQAEWPAPARGLTLDALEVHDESGWRWWTSPADLRDADFTEPRPDPFGRR